MKRIYYTISAIVIVYIIWLANKFVKAYKYLAFAVSGVALPGKNLKETVIDFLDGYGTITLKLELGNFSEASFNIENYYIELYTPDGRFVAQPENPEEIQPFTIEPKEKRTIAITYGLDLAGFAKLIGQLEGDVTKKLKTIITNYFHNGELGIEVTLKGFFKLQGMPFSIPVNYKTTI